MPIVLDMLSADVKYLQRFEEDVACMFVLRGRGDDGGVWVCVCVCVCVSGGGGVCVCACVRA